MLNREQLAAFLGNGGDSLPKKFQGNPQGFRRYDCMLTPHMREVLRQIFKCPFQESVRNLFLESKTLELMAYVMEQVVSQDNRRANPPALKPGDVERVRHAAHLLAGDLEKTPNMNELASSVGMCRSKLHQCFRMVYGITPFDYLRNRRLETAMLYLTERGMNVTEASYAVGYSSPSYFTRSFTKYFGHPPSQCRKVSISAINGR
jgi:AraC-like DNA-binding protein